MAFPWTRARACGVAVGYGATHGGQEQPAETLNAHAELFPPAVRATLLYMN